MLRCVMTLISRAVFALLTCGAFAGACWAQEGIPLPRFRPPPPPPIRIVPIHPVSGQKGDAGDSHPPDSAVCIGFLAVIGGTVVLILAFAAWRNRTVAHVRVVRTPPGEAPETIRRAWVGVKLPLRRWETEPCLHQTEGVLSQRMRGTGVGYAVSARAAVNALASHSPEAAEWWRTNSPHFRERGQLWFPVDVCEHM
jgi:hypothetical protein